MKKMRMILCFILSLVMILTMSGMTAYSSEGIDSEQGQDMEEVTYDELTDDEIIYDEEYIEAEEPVLEEEEVMPEEDVFISPEPRKEGQKEPAMARSSSQPGTNSTGSVKYPAYTGPVKTKVAKYKVIPGYGRIKVQWSAVPLAKAKNANYRGKNGTVKETKVSYRIYRNGEYKTTVARPQWENTKNVKMYTKYTYKIVAVKTIVFIPNDRSGNVIVAKAKPVASKTINNAQCVRKMRIKVRARSTRYLTSHDGKNKHFTFRSGKKVLSDHYRAGAYYFSKNGATFRIMRENARALEADYSRSGKNYTWETANYFVNDYVRKNKVSTGKKYMIWVSSYHQRLYLMKKKNGKWKCVDGWDISMGEIDSPSPTGLHYIHNKHRSKNGIKYYNHYSSRNGNALHGINDSMKGNLGRLASHGCIRNNNKGAKFIYYNCPNNTKVLVY